MFETLSGKLSGSLRKVRGRGRLTEENVSKTLNEVKMALWRRMLILELLRLFYAQLTPERLVKRYRAVLLRVSSSLKLSTRN